MVSMPVKFTTLFLGTKHDCWSDLTGTHWEGPGHDANWKKSLECFTIESQLFAGAPVSCRDFTDRKNKFKMIY